MYITLTDKDGIQFNVNTLLINEVNKIGGNTVIFLDTGETIECIESPSKVWKMIIDVKFFGKGKK